MSYSTAIEKNSSLELEDQKWFPKFLRAYQTDVLGAFAKVLKLYNPARNLLNGKLKPGQTLVDLGSGSGLPAVLVTKEMNVSLILSDKFPEINQVRFMSQKEKTEYLSLSIDVLNNALPSGDFYTMFNGLHHFSISEIAKILRKAKAKNTSIYFFEPISPTFLVYVKVALTTLLLPFFLVPFIKPFRWDRIILTYLLPIGIVATFWDGMVSVGKSYSTNKLNRFQTSFASEDMSLSHGVLKGKFANLTYLGLEI